MIQSIRWKPCSPGKMTVGSNTLYFGYDASGVPMTVTYNGTTYFYATNLQGDVVAILDSTGKAVVQYTYDAWGKLLSTTGSLASTLGVHNPLRYRGYVYDPETGLYYLQSRYYDPGMGRFINADSFTSTGQSLTGCNMFAYCNNNPVCYNDVSGEFPWLVVLGIVACVAAIGFDHYLAKNYPEGVAHKNIRKEDPLIPGAYSTAKVAYAKGSGFKFDPHNSITICDLDCGMLETSYGTDSVRVSGLNAATLSATIEADWSGPLTAEVSGLASLYSANAECQIPLPKGQITLSGAFHAGAIGVGYELDINEKKMSAITPLLPGIVVEWDIDVDVDLSR